MSAGPDKGFHIFLSYRREGTSAHAGRLHDFLVGGVDDEPGFADNQIFMDIDTIQPGDDFRKVIAEAVASCDVFLAVIGRQWVDVTDKDGRRRLDKPADYVRLEIEAALEREIPVIPVLVDGAEMPAETELPESISTLVYRNGVELSDKRWRYDVGQLLVSLNKRQVAAALARTSPPAPPTPEPRQATPIRAPAEIELPSDEKPERVMPVVQKHVATELTETPGKAAVQPVADPPALATARRDIHTLLSGRVRQLESEPRPREDIESARHERRRQVAARRSTAPTKRRTDVPAFGRAWARWSAQLPKHTLNRRRSDFKTMWEVLRPDEEVLVVAQCSNEGDSALLALTSERLIVAQKTWIQIKIPREKIKTLANRTGGIGRGKLEVSFKGQRGPLLITGVSPRAQVDAMVAQFLIDGLST